jgi:hypothetical protein
MTAMRKVDAPAQVRAGVIAPAGGSDAGKRTASLVWTTGAAVRRYSWFADEVYDEVLSLDPGAVRLDRLNHGAPLLDSHAAYRLEGVLGVVEPGTAAVANGEGRATVRFSERDEVAPIFADVQAGIIRNVSVGYRVLKYERTPPVNPGDVAVYKAVDWEPYEISLCAVGADAGAGVRARSGAAQAATNPCEIVDVNRAGARNQEVTLTEEEKKAAGPAAAAGQPANAVRTNDATSSTSAATATPAIAAEERARIEADAARAERARQAEIRSIARVAKIGEAEIERAIAEGTSVQAFRDAAWAALAARSNEGGEVRTHVRVLNDERGAMLARVENAIMHRCSPQLVKLEDGAREFRSLTMLELARDLLDRRGVKTRGLGRFELAGLALGLDGQAGIIGRAGLEGTSDLANVLANVMNKTLRRQYEGTPRTFVAWAGQSTNPDFKTITRTLLSGAPSLLQVNESGEYKRGAVTDGKETYALATYGRVVAFSRQALINDDLSALSRLPSLMGRAAADLESDTVYAVLTGNAALADSIALFHASHANLAGAGAVISVTSLGAARAAMRLQTGLEGRLINLVPEYLIVPAALEQVAYQYTSGNYVPAQPSNTNEFRAGGKTALTPVVEPRLDANSTTAYYLAAGTGQIDTIEYCYLEGNEGVYTESRVGFDVDGVEMKVRHDFAAKALDFRGLYKQPGA